MRCPGQDTQYWKPGAIYDETCPKCGKPVEFFKDDTTRKCPGCGHRFVNPKMDFGCAAYCQYAEQCLGDLPPELAAQQENLLKDRVAIEVKRYFGRDFRRIGHASRVARYAEKIGRQEEANLAVVLAAAYLKGVVTHEDMGNSAIGSPEDGQIKGVEIAEKILNKLGAREKLIAAVCAVLTDSRGADTEAGVDFKVVYDAEQAAALEEKFKDLSREQRSAVMIADTSFLTKSGHKCAEQALSAI